MRPYGLVIQRGFRVETAQEKATFYIGEGSTFAIIRVRENTLVVGSLQYECVSFLRCAPIRNHRPRCRAELNFIPHMMILRQSETRLCSSSLCIHSIHSLPTLYHSCAYFNLPTLLRFLQPYRRQISYRSGHAIADNLNQLLFCRVFQTWCFYPNNRTPLADGRGSTTLFWL